METPKSTSKVVLLAEARSAAKKRGAAVPIRRYRIARLPLSGRPAVITRLDSVRTA